MILVDLDGLSDIDLIKIDVQGAELDVFRGGGKALANALMVITEVEFVELYTGQPLLRRRGQASAIVRIPVSYLPRFRAAFLQAAVGAELMPVPGCGRCSGRMPSMSGFHAIGARRR